MEEKAFRQQWLKESPNGSAEEAKTLNCEICVVYSSRNRTANETSKKSVFIGLLPHCEKHRKTGEK